ncbi:MAG: hydrogenase expression/formation protein HypE [Candidatus Helarchaeota archaeon]|nr:hydrogenase expression/formation protein HypE [Candidatus Helarchaeota archaeon]
MSEIIRLISEVITEKNLPNGIGLKELDDGGTVPMQDYEIVFAGDAHAVHPIFYPGGNIGKLAISGTVNDLLMMGAKPLAIADTLVVEEGFEIKKLKKILETMNETAKEAHIAIIAGDFKVVPKGKIDQILISTFGIGIVKKNQLILDSGLQPGDKIILTGSIGDHGIAIMAHREGIEFETELLSDTAPLVETIQAALSVGQVTAMKDPTRGGIAAALNEFAEKSNVSIWLRENQIPIKEAVHAASEMLGIDPYEVTCEGKALIGVKEKNVNQVLETIKKTKYGKDAAIIGTVKSERPGMVILETKIGGHRIVEMPYGEPIPRVC